MGFYNIFIGVCVSRAQWMETMDITNWVEKRVAERKLRISFNPDERI